MVLWEYRPVTITYDEKAKDWVVNYSDGRVVGFSNVLNSEGKKGWELVSLVVSYQKGTNAHFASADVMTYLAVFKRPLAST